MSAVNLIPARALNGLGLSPSDPCYDPNHPWYLPDFINDDVECACMAAAETGVYPLGEQCSTVSGVAQTMGAQAGSVVGAVSNVAGGIVGGAASGISSTIGLSGTVLLVGGLAIAALILMVVVKR